MKKRSKIIHFSILITIAFYSICFAVQYGNYQNSNYNYKIIIPASWKKVELTLSSKHFMYASKDKKTEIKVRAFKSSDKNIEKTAHKKKWDLRKIDPGLNKIIETKNITIKKNIVGKLLIFEYRSNKKKFLQRALITINNGIIYIIECRSPRNIFYKYEDMFTTAFASFQYIEGGAVAKKPVKEMKPNEGNDDGLEEDATEEDEKI